MDIADPEVVRKDFPATGHVAYMNNASNAPMPIYSIKAVTDFLVECSQKGPDSRAMLESIEERVADARKDIARLINCREDEIVFTQSTTEGINCVSRGLAMRRGENVIIRDGEHEHPANYVPWLGMRERGTKLKKLTIDENGGFDLGELEAKIDPKTKLIAVSHALFNTGLILPVERAARIARKNGVLFFLDAAQTVGCMPVDVKKIGCDFAAFTGSKWLCGPQGTGVFYCSKKAAEELEPLQSGGESAHVLPDGSISYREMPQRMQAGFRNWAGIAGLSASIRYVTRLGIDGIRTRNMRLAGMLREELSRLGNAALYGPEKEEERTSIVSFNIGSLDPGMVVARLEEHSIIFAKRDISKKRIARASPHFFNHEHEIQKAVEVIRKLQ